MGQIKILSDPIVKDGVQGIVLVKEDNNFFNQKYILVQDYNDRGRGNGIRMYGLPGGAIEKKDGGDVLVSIFRELFEEIAYNSEWGCSFEEFGCYTKLRPNGQINNNHLFILRLDYVPELKTNDPGEVSEVHILSLREIIGLYPHGFIHEGSIRLIIHHLNGQKNGSLDDPVILNDIKF